MLEPFKISAFALPIADLILDVFERCRFAEIRYRKDRREHRLQADEIALFRNKVHLKEPVIGFTLDLDQVRDLRGRVDL